MTRYIEQAQAINQRIPASLRVSFLPFFIGLLPLIACTAIGPKWLIPFFVLFSLPLHYYLGLTLQDHLFEVNQIYGYVYFVTPFYATMGLWGLVLHFSHRLDLWFSIGWIYAVALVLLIAPVFRFRKRITRYFPLHRSYTVISFFIMFVQILFLRGLINA